MSQYYRPNRKYNLYSPDSTELFRYLSGSRQRSDEDKSPLDILKERYARGEISKKEFEEMKKELR